MIHVCQDNLLSKDVDELEVTPDALIRLKLGKGNLGRIHFEEKMCNLLKLKPVVGNENLTFAC